MTNSKKINVHLIHKYSIYCVELFRMLNGTYSVSYSFDSLPFTGGRDWDRMSDRLSHQAILDEKMKKFFAVRVSDVFNNIYIFIDVD